MGVRDYPWRGIGLGGCGVDEINGVGMGHEEMHRDVVGSPVKGSQRKGGQAAHGTQGSSPAPGAARFLPRLRPPRRLARSGGADLRLEVWEFGRCV